MHPYVVSLGFASLISAACGGAVLLHQRQHRGNQLAGVLLLGCAYWALMELLANLAPSAQTAGQLFRLSCFGPNFLGPLFLHIFLESAGEERRRARWLRNVLYVVATGLSVLAVTTDLFIAGATPSYWGHHLQVGPLFPLAYLTGALGAVTGLALGFRVVDRLSDGERMQLPWVIAGAAIPMGVAGTTDLVMPMLGIHFPPFGSVSLAFVAVLIVWIDVRFGYSLLTPGSFATEILEILPDGVALLRPDDRIRSANEGLARLSGRSADELQDLPIGEILAWSFDADELDEVDCDLVNREGARIPVTVASSSLFDRLGNSLGRVLVVRDLREVADLRRRLVTSARLAAVGELAAGIAHEINNPLAFVRSNLSQLESSWKHLRDVLPSPDPTTEASLAMDDVEELVGDSLEGVDRAAEIIRGVKSFSHAGVGAREETDLNGLLDDVLRMAAAQLRESIRVERDFAELPRIECTPHSLRQVFLNLVVNASQAIEGGGTILVRSRPMDGGITVDVADDGCGIAPEIIERIFDPFFTTKGVGEGTGLGLGIAYQIVQQHGGSILVESTPGIGTCFSVSLPS